MPVTSEANALLTAVSDAKEAGYRNLHRKQTRSLQRLQSLPGFEDPGEVVVGVLPIGGVGRLKSNGERGTYLLLLLERVQTEYAMCAIAGLQWLATVFKRSTEVSHRFSQFLRLAAQTAHARDRED